MESVVLENKLGGSGRAGFPKAHPTTVRQHLTTALGVLPHIALGAEQVSGPKVHPKCMFSLSPRLAVIAQISELMLLR